MLNKKKIQTLAMLVGLNVIAKSSLNYDYDAKKTMQIDIVPPIAHSNAYISFGVANPSSGIIQLFQTTHNGRIFDV